MKEKYIGLLKEHPEILVKYRELLKAIRKDTPKIKTFA